LSEAPPSGIQEALQRKIWTVDELTGEVKKLVSKASPLPSEIRANIPKFPGDWAEERLKAYVEKFGDSILNPIRHKNKEKLEDLGVTTIGIPGDVLEDTAGIIDVMSALEGLGPSGPLYGFVTKKGIVADWLRLGAENCKTKLSGVSIAKAALGRIITDCPSARLKDELLMKSVTDTAFVQEASDIITNVNSLVAIGIEINDMVGYEKLVSDVDYASRTLSDLRTEYGVPEAEIGEKLKGKSLSDAREILSSETADASSRLAQLKTEWRLYSDALASMGESISDMPEGITEISSDLLELKARGIKKLGKNGMAILSYLRGTDEFPEGVTAEDAKQALKLLRPLFMRGLGQEGKNANS
jgi:hypothetical protein